MNMINQKMYKIVFLLITATYFTVTNSFKSFMDTCSFARLAPASMFSGIIEEIGSVSSLKKENNVKLWDGSVTEGFLLEVLGKVSLEESYIGCSISVNGVCLTAIAIDNTKSSITFGLAPETLRRSNLGSLRTGSKVNLERALLNSECFHLFLYIR